MARVDLARAKELYPSCDMGVDAWVTFFGTSAGQAAIGSILYDLWDEVQSKIEYDRGERRIGRRPKRDPVPLSVIRATLFPDEFTLEPIPVALPKLLKDRQQREFAAEMPMDPGHFSRILNGRVVPNLSVIQRIAEVAGVNPYFFAEYRAQYVGQLIQTVMLTSPNLGITAVKQLRHLRGGSR